MIAKVEIPTFLKYHLVRLKFLLLLDRFNTRTVLNLNVEPIYNLKMKNLIASLLLGLFSFLFVTPLTAETNKNGIAKDLVNKLEKSLSVAVLDGVTPDVTPQYSKLTTFFIALPTFKGHSSEVITSMNSPPVKEITNKKVNI